MKTIFKRFMAETPAFFKKVQVFGGSLASAGVTISAIPGIPENIKHMATQAIWAGLLIAGLSQLTCSKPEDLK